MQIMTRDDLRDVAPSIFTRSPYHTMTDRYRVAATADVVDLLEGIGLFPVRARQSRCRQLDKRKYVKHLIRFRRSEDIDAGMATEIPEVVLTNSFDGTSAYRLNVGLWRVACLNGLVCPTGELGGISVRHSGDDLGKRIIDATYSVVSDSVKALDTVEAWKSLIMTRPEQLEMAHRAMDLKPNPAVKAAFLLTARREADYTDGDGNRDLWTTTNVLEESLIRGGVQGINGRGRRIRTRPVKQIEADIRIHKGLWTLAEAFSRN